MKKLGLFIIVGLLSMTIPQMNANTFTVQAATIKKVIVQYSQYLRHDF